MADSAPHASHDGEPDPQASAAAPQGGLMHSLRTLLATLVATLRTRGELLQVELEEERLRVAGIVMVAAAAAFFLALAVLMFSFLLILLFWDTHRVLVAGLLGVGYLVIGVGCALAARQRSRAKSRLFAASLAELTKDQQQLTPD